MNKFLFLLGTLLLILPFGLKVWESERQDELIATYSQNVKEKETEELEAGIASARDYNRQLFETGKIDLERYENELNLFENGIMGSLEVPRISLKLPIYHGTEEDVLARGIGHLKESSLPIGGVNSHSVLSGHRGLPNAQLFTRLDELKKGDVFSIKINQNTLNYCVTNIVTVKPDDTEGLRIQEGKDLVSLVTCTPYGINTHRLIVTGERIVENKKVGHLKEASWISKRDICFLLIPVLFLGFVLMKKRKKEEDKCEKMDCIMHRGLTKL